MNIQGYSSSFFALQNSPFSAAAKGASGASPLSAKMQVATQTAADKTATAQTFANEMVRRLEQNSVQGNFKDTKGEDVQFDSDAVERSTNLAKSLTDTTDFVRSRYGDKAATAFMGIITQSVGDGAVSEQALGRGMLNAVRFVDRNFGFSEGDALINNLNGNLNDAVNEYFDNGQLEKIYASKPGESFSQSALAGFAAKVQQHYGSDASDTVTSLIEEALKDSENSLGGLRSGMKNAKGWLEEKFGIDAQQDAALMNAATSSETQAPPVKGMLLNASV